MGGDEQVSDPEAPRRSGASAEAEAEIVGEPILSPPPAEVVLPAGAAPGGASKKLSPTDRIEGAYVGWLCELRDVLEHERHRSTRETTAHKSAEERAHAAEVEVAELTKDVDRLEERAVAREIFDPGVMVALAIAGVLVSLYPLDVEGEPSWGTAVGVVLLSVGIFASLISKVVRAARRSRRASSSRTTR